jgi:hypothetical protein
MCFAAYGGALAAVGLDAYASWWWARAVVWALLGCSVLLVIWMSSRRRDVAAAVVVMVGVVALGWGYSGDVVALELVGALAITGAAWWNAMRCRDARDAAGVSSGTNGRLNVDGLPNG